MSEYLEFYDSSIAYQDLEPKYDEDQCWTSIKTVNSIGEPQIHKVRLVLPLKAKYYNEAFGFLTINPHLAGQNRKGKKKKTLMIVWPTYGSGHAFDGEYEAPPLGVDDANKKGTMSASNMGGYKSALVWYIKNVRGCDSGIEG